MSLRVFIGFGLLCLFTIVGAAAEDTKPIWTRATDGRTVEAELVSYDPAGDQVTLRLGDGRLSTFSAALLIEADRERLRSQAEAEAKKALAQAAKETERKALASIGRWDSFVPETGGGFKVHTYLPPGYMEGDASNRGRPVAFLFSPGGNSRSIMERAKLAADELGWVLIGVDAYRNMKSLEERYEERMRHTRAAFEAASARVVFDPKKIVFGGMSGGAWWSYQCASELTAEAAGIVACGGWMGDMYDKRYSSRMAVAMIIGDGDSPALNYAKRDGNFLKGKASAKVKEFSFAGGHVLPPKELFTEAARWIHKEKKF